jgi:hypothetical protein
MSGGYGRGYYGAEQLAPQPPKRRGGGWIKIAVVVGVGAVVWYMWPRKPKLYPFETAAPPPPFPPQQSMQQSMQQSQQPMLPSPPPSWQTAPAVPPPSQLALAPVSGYAEAKPLEPMRDYAEQKAYEDAVVASARQLQDTGAKVVLAPHLQYLTSRLGS